MVWMTWQMNQTKQILVVMYEIPCQVNSSMQPCFLTGSKTSRNGIATLINGGTMWID